MNGRRPLSRRDFALSAAAATLAAPFLKSLTARAASAAPKRLLTFFSANGSVYDSWRPTGGEADFKLSYILEPLAAHRDKLLILDGIDNKVAEDFGACNHWGATTLLTGSTQDPNLPGSCHNFAQDMSVDQFIANAISSTTPFRSIELGATHDGIAPNSAMAVINQTSSQGQIFPTSVPKLAFDQVFGSLIAANRNARARSSALDILKGEMKDLSAKLGKEDQIRLDKHLEAFRQLEVQIAAPTTCGNTSIDFGPSPTIPGNELFGTYYREVCKAQIDILVMALACDLTRVASMILWNMYVTHTWAGSKSMHHELSHLRGVEGGNGDTPELARAAFAADQRWVAEMFAYLLTQLTDHGLMDNTVVVWLTEMGDGSRHFFGNIPIVMAGSAGGYFKTGRYLTYGTQRAYADPSNPLVWSGVNHNRLLVSLCHAMGLTDVASYGVADYCVGGALDRLT